MKMSMKELEQKIFTTLQNCQEPVALADLGFASHVGIVVRTLIDAGKLKGRLLRVQRDGVKRYHYYPPGVQHVRKPGRYRDVDMAFVMECKAAGMSVYEIAKLIDCPCTTLYYKLDQEKNNQVRKKNRINAAADKYRTYHEELSQALTAKKQELEEIKEKIEEMETLEDALVRLHDECLAKDAEIAALKARLPQNTLSDRARAALRYAGGGTPPCGSREA